MWGRLLQRIMRDHWLMLLASAICLAFAFAFAEVGSDVLEGDNKRIDYSVREWMRSHHTDLGHRVFVVLSHFGDRVVLIPLALIVGWPLFRGHLSWIVLMLFVGLSSAELVAILKQGFGVLRPPLGLQHSKSFAFPSGHTTATATFATVLGYLSMRREIAPLAYVVGGTVLTLLVATSRMYLDMHWASDVLGGILIGSTFAAGSCALFEWLTIAFKSLHRRRYASSPSLREEAAMR